MGFKVVTPPATEPVTLAEARLHLRLPESDDDGYVAALISAAREQCEQACERSIGTQTLLLTSDGFPATEIGSSKLPVQGICLPRPPATSVIWVKYLDASGALQTLDNTAYWLDTASDLEHFVRPVGAWPGAKAYPGAVTVQYVAGLTVVPVAIKQWILLMIGVMYENREAQPDSSTARHPTTMNHYFFDHLIDRMRRPGL
jgi:uncharacterized phiE125 gp8 family phage protein